MWRTAVDACPRRRVPGCVVRSALETPPGRAFPAEPGRRPDEGRNVTPVLGCDKRFARVATTPRAPLDSTGSPLARPTPPPSLRGCFPPPPLQEAMREADVPAQQPEAQEDPRIPGPDADARRARGDPVPPPARPQATRRLLWRVRDRATFAALAQARSRRAGPVRIRPV